MYYRMLWRTLMCKWQLSLNLVMYLKIDGFASNGEIKREHVLRSRKVRCKQT